MATRGRSNRIDAYRDLSTGRVGSAHRIGQTVGGYDLFQFMEGWEPVCRHIAADGCDFYVSTTRLQHDRDGN